ncbi:hypothetical protein Leryth_017784 [Lithospermum erythrorhizon]|nr:hypothetical protein Leryth_017784 [Lithospermum erythrorhizon]
MTSWVRTITSPFRKACTFFNQPPTNNKKSNQDIYPCQDNRTMDLQGEVMACGYEDVQVMWSILDKSNPNACNLSR